MVGDVLVLWAAAQVGDALLLPTFPCFELLVGASIIPVMRLRWSMVCLALCLIPSVGLAEDPEEYETVVTASRGKERAFESPRAITVLGRKKMNERTPGSLPDALKDEPGLTMQRTNTAGGAPILRGMVGQHVLLLVDGVRLNNAVTRFGPNQLLNTVDPFLVEQVEVLRGPGAVLHGSDALGGVINIITRKPTFNPRRAWDASAEAVGRFHSADLSGVGHVGAEGHLRSVGVRVGGSLKRFGDLTGGRDTGEQPFTSYNEGNASLSAAWIMGDSSVLRLGYSMTRQYDAPRTDRSSPTDFRRFTEQFRDMATLNFSSEFENKIVQRLDTTVSFHSHRELRERFCLAGGCVSQSKRSGAFVDREQDDVHSVGAQLTLSSELPWNNQLRYGLDLYHDWVGSSLEWEEIATLKRHPQDRGRYLDGSRYLQLGGYVTDRLSIGEKLALDLGVRVSVWDVDLPADTSYKFDAFHTTHVGVAGSLHARYLVGDGLNIVAGVSQGFRAPNVDDYSATGCSGQGYDIPNEDLDAEKSVTAEAGVKMDLAGIVTGSFFYYFTYVDDVIVRQLQQGTGGTVTTMVCGGTPTPVLRRVNASSGTIHGLELSLALNLGARWSLFSWLAWSLGDVSQEGKESEPMSRTPPLNGMAGVRFAITEVKGFAELGLRWSAPQDRLNTRDLGDRRICPLGPANCEGTPGYAVLTLRGAAELVKPLRLTLAVENFTNQTYRVHGSGVDGAGVSAMVGMELVVK